MSESPGFPGPPMRGRMGGAKPSLRTATEVFRFRHYRYLWVSSAFSFTGMQMQQVARALLAWELTKSFGAVGAISLSFGLPMLLFSLIGGSLADRFEKRNLSLMTQSVTGVLALITAVLVATDTITFQLLFLVGLVQGTAFAFGMPARTPLMAEVVGPQNVMSAIAMSNASMNATRLFGPAVAGVLIGFWGIESAYFVQASLYVVSAVMLLQVPTGLSVSTGAPGFGPPRGNMFADIGRGLRYVATDPRLRLLNGMMFIVSFFAMPYVMLLAGFVQEDLGKSERSYGFLISISGGGALVGSLAIATLTAYSRKPLIQWASGILGGVGLISLALGSSTFGYAGAILAIVVLGLVLTAYQTLNNTMIMDEARPEYYGRVMSINMLSFSAMPLMAFPLGAVADAIGADTTFMAQGLIIIAFMAFVALVNPRYTFGETSPPAWRSDPGMMPAFAAPGGHGGPPAGGGPPGFGGPGMRPGQPAAVTVHDEPGRVPGGGAGG